MAFALKLDGDRFPDQVRDRAAPRDDGLADTSSRVTLRPAAITPTLAV
jgi:hypothetical protein